MDKKMNVLDVQIDDCTAKEAMKAVVDYMKTEALNSVEMVTADTLMRASRMPDMKYNMSELDLVLPGDRAVLEVAGVTEKRRFQETEEKTFLKMLLRYLHKNHRSLFLLTDTEEEAEKIAVFLESRYSGIRLTGHALVPKDDSADDWITNQINGVESGVDCILASLSSPVQETFVKRCLPVLNARLWFAPGRSFLPEEGKKISGPIREFIEKRILKREVEKTKKEG